AAARAWAFIDGRIQVLPEDIQTVWASVACHRLPLVQDGDHARAEEAEALLRSVALP
ncbi:MAG: AAA family ATPase, partial [Betaproteobacteria bacterium]|nr:AAA family ATPase [Betaproteobacteria bacterium]